MDSTMYDNKGINQLTDCTDCTAAVGVFILESRFSIEVLFSHSGAQ